MAHLQPYASRCDGRHAEGVGPEGTPQGLSQKSSGAEEAPAETRGYNQAIPCLHRQTAQESKSQCGDTLTGLAMPPIPWGIGRARMGDGEAFPTMLPDSRSAYNIRVALTRGELS